jgi:hypothetical protein
MVLPFLFYILNQTVDCFLKHCFLHFRSTIQHFNWKSSVTFTYLMCRFVKASNWIGSRHGLEKRGLLPEVMFWHFLSGYNTSEGNHQLWLEIVTDPSYLLVERELAPR